MDSGMDLNLVVICGRLAADPELRVFDSGSRMLRFLVVVRSKRPQSRVDVIPVTLWDPPDEVLGDQRAREDRIWAVGAIQRRYWEASDGRRSRIEVIAEQVMFEEQVDLTV